MNKKFQEPLFQTETIEDCRVGEKHILSNIGVCEQISDFMAPTLGPFGLDKMFFGNETVITNDGATILGKMEFNHPVAKLITEISISQDKLIGDGTTSVVLLAAEILSNCKELLNEKFEVEDIVRVFPLIKKQCIAKITECKIDLTEEIIYKLCETSLTSKVIRNSKIFFSQLLVNSMFSKLEFEEPKDQKSSSDMETSEIIPFVRKDLLYVFQQGGSFEDSFSVSGIVFEKTFGYAGYEQQPKRIENPLVLIIDIELELRSEKQNSEVKIDSVEEYQNFIDAEHRVLYEKLEKIMKTGAKVVLSSQSIGDFAVQFFAKNHMFSAGRVSNLSSISKCLKCSVCTTTETFTLGKCDLFEERQLGNKRYNYLMRENASVSTLVVRGPSKHVLEEVKRSLHDAECILKLVSKEKGVVTGGGSIEMTLSSTIRNTAFRFEDIYRFVLINIGKSLEKIPTQLSENFGQNAVQIIQTLRKKHQESVHYGVTFSGVGDMKTLGVFEPVDSKISYICCALDLAQVILRTHGTVISK